MRRLSILLAATALVWVATPGCSSIEEDLCEAECACEGCSEVGHSKCVQEYDADRAAAEHRGCIFEYDDLQDCRDATGTCVHNDWETSCKPEKDRHKFCMEGK